MEIFFHQLDFMRFYNIKERERERESIKHKSCVSINFDSVKKKENIKKLLLVNRK